MANDTPGIDIAKRLQRKPPALFLLVNPGS